MPNRLIPDHLLTALLESPEEGILSVSPDGTILAWSRGAERIYGYTAEEMNGQHLRRLVPLDELPEMERVFAKARGTGLGISEATERLHKDGSRIFLRVKRTLVRDEHGEVRAILESGRKLNSNGADPTAEGPLRSIIEQMPGLHWIADRNLRITSNWGKGMASSGISPGALVGRSVCEFLECADRHSTPIAEHGEALRGLSSHFECKWKNRSWEIRLGPLRLESGEINGCLGSGMDITDRKRNEEQALYQARHDPLTGLANYREFMDRLEQEVRRAERSHHSFTVLLLELDGLKRINDSQGWPETVLCSVGGGHE